MNAQTKQIASLHQQGWTYGDLADAFGMTRNAIAGLLHRNGVNAGGRRWKLTPQQAREIRARVAAGEPRAAIAQHYGVHLRTTYRVTSRTTFADVA